MLTIGCHLSFTKGFCNMGKEALSIDANTFQFFSRNPRGSKTKEWDTNDIDDFLGLREENGIGVILAHAPYTMNPCSAKKDIRELALQMMTEDLDKLESIPQCLYNFHPGSHVGQGTMAGIEMISDLLNRILEKDPSTIVLLETMAGKGSEVGKDFYELAEIIYRVENKDKLGVCLDTCHIFDGGYDIVNDLEGVLKDFDNIIGISKLKAVHLNDSKNPLGSHKDRHEKIGLGKIGKETLSAVTNDERLKDLPFYLETPNELEGYRDEIALLRSMYKY